MPSPNLDRHPTTQDVTWFLDLRRNKQINLEPRYQRRSVWTRKDRQFFLDTIFNGFPSPAIYLHKETSDEGGTIYHVVDGKQRLETIFMFVDDRIAIARDFGNTALNGKKWSDLAGELSLRQALWNYRIPVEFIRFTDETLIKHVFDRLNRNSRKLTPQELRHARFEGWLMTAVENEREQPEWVTFGITTSAREKRMVDSQFISELMLIALEGRIRGFDQDALDTLYAEYDDVSPDTGEPELARFRTADEYLHDVRRIKTYLQGMEAANHCVTTHATSFASFHSLWAVVALNASELGDAAKSAELYAQFMSQVSALREDAASGTESPAHVKQYADHLRGASTDEGPRRMRYEALLQALRRA